MNRETWKSIERWWAEQLGGKRNPVSGRSRGDKADIEHELYAIEVKCGSTLSARLQEGMDQAVEASEIEYERDNGEKLPLLCITHNRRGNRGSIHWVAMRLEDFKDWYMS